MLYLFDNNAARSNDQAFDGCLPLEAAMVQWKKEWNKLARTNFNLRRLVIAGVV